MHMCLCHHVVKFGTGQRMVLLYGWAWQKVMAACEYVGSGLPAKQLESAVIPQPVSRTRLCARTNVLQIPSGSAS